jgi:catechol 2,3-dioxygenase-like lactoylglutathione lyase family enzyme
MSPKTDGILESSLYVSDLPRSVRFYEETFGFRVISDFGERGCAMHADTPQVLLLFTVEEKRKWELGAGASTFETRTAI